MSSSKEDILARLRRNTTERFPEPDLSGLEAEALTYPDPETRFIDVMGQVGGRAVIVPEGQTAGQVIAGLYPNVHRTALAIRGLAGADALPGTVFHPDDVATGPELNGTDLAIVDGSFGVCENGCVWVEQRVENRGVYFITESLVLVIPRGALVNNMHEAYRRIDTGRYGYGVFISGPSKTADIEQALVFGAHGAHDVVVLLV